MTANEFINYMEDLRVRDKRGEVYYELIKRPIAEVLDIIDRVEGKISDDELDVLIKETREHLLKYVKL